MQLRAWQNPHALGAVLIVTSELGFGSTGVFTRNIDAGALPIAAWRGLVGGTVVFAYLWLRARRQRRKLRLRIGARGMVLAVITSASMMLFIAALQRTAVANVSVLVATSPFMAAALGWMVLRERLHPVTAAAAMVAFAGILLTVTGGRSLDLGAEGMDGNLMAVGLAFSLALLIVLIRRFESGADGHVDVVQAMALAGGVVFVVGLAVGDPFSVDLREAPLLVVFGVVFGLSVILWTEGVRLVPSAESAMLATVETPIAIVMAWVFLSEAPPLATVAGGMLVIGAVLGRGLSYWRATGVSRP